MNAAVTKFILGFTLLGGLWVANGQAQPCQDNCANRLEYVGSSLGDETKRLLSVGEQLYFLAWPETPEKNTVLELLVPDFLHFSLDPTVSSCINVQQAENVGGRQILLSLADCKQENISSLRLQLQVKNEVAVYDGVEFSISYSWGGGDFTTIAGFEIAEPLLGLGRNFFPNQGVTAGQNITLINTLSNVGRGDLYQVQLTDQLRAETSPELPLFACQSLPQRWQSQGFLLQTIDQQQRCIVDASSQQRLTANGEMALSYNLPTHAQHWIGGDTQAKLQNQFALEIVALAQGASLPAHAPGAGDAMFQRDALHDPTLGELREFSPYQTSASGLYQPASLAKLRVQAVQVDENRSELDLAQYVTIGQSFAVVAEVKLPKGRLFQGELQLRLLLEDFNGKQSLRQQQTKLPIAASYIDIRGAQALAMEAGLGQDVMPLTQSSSNSFEQLIRLPLKDVQIDNDDGLLRWHLLLTMPNQPQVGDGPGADNQRLQYQFAIRHQGLQENDFHVLTSQPNNLVILEPALSFSKVVVAEKAGVIAGQAVQVLLELCNADPANNAEVSTAYQVHIADQFPEFSRLSITPQVLIDAQVLPIPLQLHQQGLELKLPQGLLAGQCLSVRYGLQMHQQLPALRVLAADNYLLRYASLPETAGAQRRLYRDTQPYRFILTSPGLEVLAKHRRWVTAGEEFVLAHQIKILLPQSQDSAAQGLLSIGLSGDKKFDWEVYVDANGNGIGESDERYRSAIPVVSGLVSLLIKGRADADYKTSAATLVAKLQYLGSSFQSAVIDEIYLLQP